MKKKIVKILALMLIVAFTISMGGCAKKVSEEEAKAIVRGLLADAYELNEIYFGEGLPHVDSTNMYARVLIESKYQTIYSLREDTLRVFSQDYAASFMYIAFLGSDTGYGDEVLQPRYIEDGGILYVYTDIEGIEVKEYNTENVEIVKISRRFIEAELSSLDGEVKTIVTFISTDDGWRINSASY